MAFLEASKTSVFALCGLKHSIPQLLEIVQIVENNASKSPFKDFYPLLPDHFLA